MTDILIEGFYLFLANSWLVPVGVLVGMIAGAIPGLTPSNSLVLLLPVLIFLPPEQGMILGTAIYAGAEMGNSFPAVILNIPGSAGSSITAIEGYPMTRAGKAARALGICIMASAIGAAVGGLISIAAAPSIAQVALKFSPVENSIVVMFGLVVIAQISRGGLVKGLLSGAMGLLLATVGTDPIFGQFRSTYGIVYLYDGISVVAVLVGLLGFSEVLTQLDGNRQKAHTASGPSAAMGLSGILGGVKTVIVKPLIWLRSGILGLIVGAIPGAGASVASLMAYSQEMSFARDKEREEFGKGSERGLMSADVANNAMVGGSLVPLLTLGIPGSGTMAVLLVVMEYHGLNIGPRLFSLDGTVAFAVLWSQFAAAIFLLLIGTALAFVAFRLAYVSAAFILPTVAIFCLIGGFARNEYVFDMGVVLVFGIIGYIMKRNGYSNIGLLLGAILGTMFENYLLQGFRMGHDSIGIFFERPVAVILWILLFASILVPVLLRRRASRCKRRQYQ